MLSNLTNETLLLIWPNHKKIVDLQEFCRLASTRFDKKLRVCSTCSSNAIYGVIGRKQEIELNFEIKLKIGEYPKHPDEYPKGLHQGHVL